MKLISLSARKDLITDQKPPGDRMVALVCARGRVNCEVLPDLVCNDEQDQFPEYTHIQTNTCDIPSREYAHSMQRQ